MRSYIIGFLLLSPAISNAQELSAEGSRVQQIIRGMYYAISDRNAGTLDLFCNRSILILENDQECNLDSLIKKINENKTVVDYRRTNSFEFIKTEIKQDAAWASYYILADITKNGKRNTVSWLETAILIKEDGYWKISVLHSTPIKKN